MKGIRFLAESLVFGAIFGIAITAVLLIIGHKEALVFAVLVGASMNPLSLWIYRRREAWRESVKRSERDSSTNPERMESVSGEEAKLLVAVSAYNTIGTIIDLVGDKASDEVCVWSCALEEHRGLRILPHKAGLYVWEGRVEVDATLRAKWIGGLRPLQAGEWDRLANGRRLWSE